MGLTGAYAGGNSAMLQRARANQNGRAIDNCAHFLDASATEVHANSSRKRGGGIFRKERIEPVETVAPGSKPDHSLVGLITGFMTIDNSIEALQPVTNCRSVLE
jgi:hypothetical protein